jgi:hypothetical protein
LIVARSPGFIAAHMAMIMSPRAARSARIPMTLKVEASTRIETAIAEKASNAPVIQKTTRKIWRIATNAGP